MEEKGNIQAGLIMRGICLAACILIICISAGCRVDKGLADCFDEETLKKTGEQAVMYVNQKDYEKFKDMFLEEYKSEITEELFSQITGYTDKMGEFQGFENGAVIGQTDEETGKNYAGVIVTGRYTEGEVQFRLGFTEEMKMVQFYI